MRTGPPSGGALLGLLAQEDADLMGETLPAGARRGSGGQLPQSDAARPQPASGPLLVDAQLDLDVHMAQRRLGARGENDGRRPAQRIDVESLDELRVAPVDEGALPVRADPDIDLTVLEVNTERPAPAVLHGHPDTEVGEPFGGVVASARRLARLKSVDADPQTGMLLVLLPVPDHVR